MVDLSYAFYGGLSLLGDGASIGGERGVSTVILDSGSHLSLTVWFKVFICEWVVVLFYLTIASFYWLLLVLG